MNLHQLEIFLAVLDTSTVNKAAERVHLSPGAVSVQLQKLADELQTDLFLHSGRRLVPTAAAHRLAEYSRPLVEQMEYIRQAFSHPSVDTRPFRLASGVTTLIHRLASPLQELRKQYPGTEIQITATATEQIVDGLLDRRYDLGIISLPVSADGLRIVPLYDEEFLVLRAGEGGTAQVKTISPSELKKMPFLLYPKYSNMRRLIDSHLAQVGINPRVIIEAEDTEAIKGLVEWGFGYSILPEHALRSTHRHLELLRISNVRLFRRQALAMAETKYPRKLTESIAAFLQETLSQDGFGSVVAMLVPLVASFA